MVQGFCLAIRFWAWVERARKLEACQERCQGQLGSRWGLEQDMEVVEF